MLRVALRPDLDANNLTARLSAARGKQSFSTFLRKAAGLSPAAIGLLQEVAMVSGVSLSAMPPGALAARINNVEIVLTGTSALEKSISTAGGIAFDELDANYMLRQLPGIFVAGEMLDWEAPTGGYLLQASFATGAAAGRGALKLLGK
jgi:predicted flavoprotein YhiN